MTIGTATASTFTVNNSTGPVADFTSIQAAVDAALNGDVILVYPGIYSENVDVNKQLNITSTGGSAATHVNAASFSDYVFDVTGDGVTISGFYVIGPGSTNGIYLHEIENCIISNNKVLNNAYGIFLDGSSNNNTLISNTASGNSYGIYLASSSSNNTLISNTAFGNSYGIFLEDFNNNNSLINNMVSGNSYGIVLDSSSNNNTLISNMVSDNSYGIFLDNYNNNNTLINNKVSGNSYGIALDVSTNNILISNTASGNTQEGIILLSSNNNNLTSNTISNNTAGGINLIFSRYNTLTNNTVSRNIGTGIRLEYSYNNTLTSNTASNNIGSGITLYDASDNNNLTSNTASNNIGTGINLVQFSDYNTLTNNTVSNNTGDGIYLNDASSYNILTCNKVSNNTRHGIDLNRAYNNFIYNNYFNNSENVGFTNTWGNISNVWNTTKTAGTNIIGGPYLGGNYWAKPDGTGFSQINVDMDCDGFCDSPLSKYELDVDNIDYLPLCLDAYNPYDINEDYMIDIGEVSAAIDDYRTQGPTSIAVVSKLIDMYRSGELYC